MSVYFYGCITLDGYLADKDHNLDWLYQTGTIEETGYDNFYEKMDITIMGRKTFESLPNGVLPHRRNIVVSKSLKEIDGGEVYTTLEEALRAAQDNTLSAPKEDAGIASPEEIFIIGGESIYRQALPAARKLYLTLVDKEPEQADTFFPAIDCSAWEVTEKEMRNENGLSFSFLTYIRK